EEGHRPSSNAMAQKYGELEPLTPVYREREPRLLTMNEQNVESILMFPTLGQCVEHLMYDDVDMMYRVFRSFNTWLDTDWGFNFENRIFAIPVIPMLDVDMAVKELEWVLDRGARAVCLRPGPLYGRTQADPYFDPFYSLVNESGILQTYHAIGGQSPYDDAFEMMYCQPAVYDKGYLATLEQALTPGERPVMDTLMSLILGNFFGRFPNIKVASIEMGCTWVPYFLHSLDHAGGMLERHIEAFGQKLDVRPSEVFKEKVYISPFPEEDVVGLANLIGVDHVLMGSDWPHPEGNHQPEEYVECIAGLDDASIRRIMRDNALGLIAS
ncbi:MAG TPA: amidohydrolase family protein, partial [Acidimicrobiales bacterium]|nr:amidohydrolase family protein [Acidimicrobiales bacterium]